MQELTKETKEQIEKNMREIAKKLGEILALTTLVGLMINLENEENESRNN